MTEPRDEDLAIDDDVEVVDALPVPASAPGVREPPRSGALLPAGPMAVQAAAVAVTGFAAGAATVAVVRRRRARKAVKRTRRASRQVTEVLATRSFLVDVHLLSGRD